MEWNRPKSIPYPNIWKKFDGLRELNGKIPKLWVQDVTEDLVETIIQSMMMHFIKEEPLCKYSKLVEDPLSVADAMELYRHLLRNKLTVVCMTNDSQGNPKLVGVTNLERIAKDDPHIEGLLQRLLHVTRYLGFQFNGKCLTKLLNLLDYAFSIKDLFAPFRVDEYLNDKGILPEFRGQELCYELLQCWTIICKAVGLKVVVGSFTSIVSQNVANRVEFKELNSIAYEDLEKVNPT